MDTDCLTQHWVNYLGIYTPLANTIAAILLARAADRVKGRLKEAVVGLLSLAAVVFLVLSLISVGVFQFSSLLTVQVLVTLLLITATSLVVSSMPLAMEVRADTIYFIEILKSLSAQNFQLQMMEIIEGQFEHF